MHLFLAAGEAPGFFIEIAVLIVAAAVIAYIGYRLGLVPIVGFLLTGIVIGPNALKLVTSQEMINATADVGVILLLFTIGIEFSLEKLARIQKLIFGGGGMQVIFTSLLTMGILMLFGVTWQVGLFTGFLVALSSTAIVLKLLGSEGEMNAPSGQVSLGLLIFQDLAIIVMVLLIPMLAGTGGSATDIVLALGKAGLVIAAVLLVARRVMPPLLEKVARTCSQELFLLALIAICFGTAYLTSLAGVSVALGAFLAGLVVSESRFSEHAFGEIMPLQILFSAAFFVSVGMLLDVQFLLGNLLLVAGCVVAVLVIKLLTTWVSVRALGYPMAVAVPAAFILAQIGEFSFVLQRAGDDLGLFPAGVESGAQVFIAATVVLMVLTPPLCQFGLYLRDRMTRKEAEATPAMADEALEEMEEGQEEIRLRDHVIVGGYGRSARRLVRSLRRAEIDHVVVTLSPARAREAEEEGVLVVRGDAGRPHALELAGIRRARMLVVPGDDPALTHRAATVARTLNPKVNIVARARRPSEAAELSEIGADQVITEEFETVASLYAVVLREYGTQAQDVLRQIDTMRMEDYQGLRTMPDAVAEGGSEGTAHASDESDVRVYGADWCPLTGGFRAYLRRREIPYVYFNVEEDQEAEAAVRAMNDGKLKFPMVVVGETALKNPPIDDLDAVLRENGLLQEEAQGA